MADGLHQLPPTMRQTQTREPGRGRKKASVVGLKCVMCGRAMALPAAWHHGRPYGPKCADRAGLLATRFVAQQEQPDDVDPRQMALPL